MPIILLGAEFWKKSLNFDYLLECGMCSTQCFKFSAWIHAFPPIMDLKDGVTFPIQGAYFPLNHDYGRKEVICSVTL